MYRVSSNSCVRKAASVSSLRMSALNRLASFRTEALGFVGSRGKLPSSLNSAPLQLFASQNFRLSKLFDVCAILRWLRMRGHRCGLFKRILLKANNSFCLRQPLNAAFWPHASCMCAMSLSLATHVLSVRKRRTRPHLSRSFTSPHSARYFFPVHSKRPLGAKTSECATFTIYPQEDLHFY
jgi:hypothetical protein